LSRPSPPDPPVFFIDRSLGYRTVANALEEAGYRVERHDDHYPPDTPDAQWLRDVGKNGWVVLTKDRQFDKNQIELNSLHESGAATFVLKAGNLTGSQIAAVLVGAMPGALLVLRKFDRPFIARIGKGGQIRVHLTASSLLKKLE
jgi:predicted nuclease of predicted toxin-antitoxin system